MWMKSFIVFSLAHHFLLPAKIRMKMMMTMISKWLLSKWMPLEWRRRWLSVLDVVSRKEFIKQMRLYRHTARCQAGILTFLSVNPHYWCFIPQPWNETMMTHFDSMGEPLHRESEVDHLVERGVIEHPRVAQYLLRVPLPPTRYAFSYQQRQQQRIFFRNLVTGVYGPIPYTLLDLHQYKIVAVRKSHIFDQSHFPSVVLLYSSSGRCHEPVSIHRWNSVCRACRNRVEYDLSSGWQCWAALWPWLFIWLVSRHRALLDSDEERSNLGNNSCSSSSYYCCFFFIWYDEYSMKHVKFLVSSLFLFVNDYIFN